MSCTISPVLKGCPAINPSIRHSPAFAANLSPPEVALQQVQQASHGAEQQHPVTSAVQFDEQAVQHAQLATLAQQLCLVCSIVWRVAQGRMVAHLHTFIESCTLTGVEGSGFTSQFT